MHHGCFEVAVRFIALFHRWKQLSNRREDRSSLYNHSTSFHLTPSLVWERLTSRENCRHFERSEKSLIFDNLLNYYLTTYYSGSDLQSRALVETDLQVC